MYEAKVVHRFLCRLTRRVYEPGDTYRSETWARLEELASLDPPRVELPERPAEASETAMAQEPEQAERAVRPRKRGRRNG